MIVKEFLTLSIVIIWMTVAVMSYEFYTTAKLNRFRFRYWFAIAILNIFQAILGAYYIYSNNGDIQTARWVAFVIIDILYLEIFIPPIARRTLELFVRTAFYFALVIDFMTPSPYLLLINVVVLGILARHSDYNTARNHFSFSMVLYFFVNLIPYLTGYTEILSLAVGFVFSLHIMYGVYQLYLEEQTNELIKEQILDKARREEYENTKN